MVGYYCFVKNTSLQSWTCRQISIFLARSPFFSLSVVLPFSSTAAITIPLTLLDTRTYSFFLFLSRPPILFLCSMLMTYALVLLLPLCRTTMYIVIMPSSTMDDVKLSRGSTRIAFYSGQKRQFILGNDRT